MGRRERVGARAELEEERAVFGQPTAELRAALRARGIVTEAMDTRAACRTFNVLLAEDRRVAAALIAR